jgi:hypothetical protein
MTLTLIEPGRRPNFELRTYTCGHCGADESFLMAIRQAESSDSHQPKRTPLRS